MAAVPRLKIPNVVVVGKRVFMRVDFNVPRDKQEVMRRRQHEKVDEALPTIKAVLAKGAKSVVLAAHLGPKLGIPVERYSLAPIAQILGEKLGKPVTFCNDCVGAEVEATCADPAVGSVILLENLRFHPEEEERYGGLSARVHEFRASILKLADIYFDDAFGTAKRAHSSIVAGPAKRPARSSSTASQLPDDDDEAGP